MSRIDFDAAGFDPYGGTLVEIRPAGGGRVRSLSQIPRPGPESEDPSAVLRNRFLRKGGAAMLIAPSGIGKSSFAVQAAIQWTLGMPMLGIGPARPLRVAVIQGEDDDADISEMRDGVVAALATESGVPRERLQEACDRIDFLDYAGRRGEGFTDAFREDAEKGTYDLFIVNPLHSFFEGDLSQAADCSRFFRQGIDPAIRPAKAAVLVIHHSGKPPIAARERRSWGQDAYSEYVGNGSAELTNWPRATLVIVRHPVSRRVFVLSSPKRGFRLGWTDAEGRPTDRKLIAHSGRGIFWREVGPDEAASLAPEGNGVGKSRREGGGERLERCLGELKAALAAGAKTSSEIRSLFGRPSDARVALGTVNAAADGAHGVFRAKAARNNATFYALDAGTAKAAADGYSAGRKDGVRKTV